MQLHLSAPAQRFLTASGVSVPKVQRRLLWQPQRPAEALQLQQVQDAHGFLQRQAALGAIASAAAVIEALPETLLLDARQLRGLFSALRSAGFGQQHLTSLLTNVQRRAALDLLQLPAGEVAPRLAHLRELLFLKQDQLPAFVSGQPALLAVTPAHAAASVGWLRATLGWSNPTVRRHAELVERPAAELEAAAELLQSSLDMSTAELVLLLHIAPQLLLASPSELQGLLSSCATTLELAQAACTEQHARQEAAAGEQAAASQRQRLPPPAAGSAAPAPPGMAWDRQDIAVPMQPPLAAEYAAERERQKLCALKLCSVHGLTLDELSRLLRDKPTLLREVRL